MSIKEAKEQMKKLRNDLMAMPMNTPKFDQQLRKINALDKKIKDFEHGMFRMRRL
jgi:uncharacterized protein YdcH (DUF465 family)